MNFDEFVVHTTEEYERIQENLREIDVLVKHDLSLSKEKSFIEVAKHRVLFPIVVNDENEDIIEVVPVKASAGYLNGYADPEYIEQL